MGVRRLLRVISTSSLSSMLFFKVATASAALVLLPAAVAQFVPAPTDLTSVVGGANYTVRYKEVPSGICETTPGVKSYSGTRTILKGTYWDANGVSGYIDVDTNQHIFWWFFEARNVDPSTAPVTIWLNGGPGDPSMVGLFSDNGPCWVDYDGDLRYNKYSWNNVSNMIYIDQPTQVGFSYAGPINGYVDPDSGYTVTVPGMTCPDYAPADSCGTFSNGNLSLTANSTDAAAPNVWKTVQGLMGAFPQYARHGIHLSTESYGGHYGPVFAEYFETQNAANIAGAQKISLQSLSVGNGWYDPRIQYPSYYNYTVVRTAKRTIRIRDEV